MDCYSVLREVGNYIDREVSPSSKAEIELHLGCCRNCHAVYNTVEKTIRIYCEDRVEVPEAVRKKIDSTLQALIRDGGAEGTVTSSRKWFTIAKRVLRQLTGK